MPKAVVRDTEAAVSAPRSRSGGPVTVLGPLTVPDLAGRELRDERSLSLAQAPAYVVRHDREGGRVRYAVVLGEALGRRALMDLLFTTAPYKAHGPDRFARVLDNWRLHDRAMTSSGSESLLLQHAESLKLSWRQFSRHRDLFIAILEDETEDRRVVPVVTWERSLPGGARKWQFDALDRTLVQALEASVPILRGRDGLGWPQLDSLVGLVTIPYFLPKLRKNWRPWQPLVKNGKSNYVGPASMPRSGTHAPKGASEQCLHKERRGTHRYDRTGNLLKRRVLRSSRTSTSRSASSTR